MQQWFYAYEVIKEGEVIQRFSGVYPGKACFKDADILAIDFSDPEEVMGDLQTKELISRHNCSVYFTAFNRL
ncbi:hypothetical protein LZP96_09805 [Enterobacteriaceae bacterium 155047]|uniref:hypothetical protein n=1 Tax=Huaxiibacter chinensis TaxID=2899785 RepID=UPI002164EAD6|nr:hypothetical protein [Huaxiibacter chinensis]MCG5044331.1 hypothetical protein [Huaxiibacter chinensis]